MWCLTTLTVWVHLPGVFSPVEEHFIWHWNVEKESFICPTEEKWPNYLEMTLHSVYYKDIWAYSEHMQSLREWCQSEQATLHAQHLGIWYLAQGYLGCALKISQYFPASHPLSSLSIQLGLEPKTHQLPSQASIDCTTAAILVGHCFLTSAWFKSTSEIGKHTPLTFQW